MRQQFSKLCNKGKAKTERNSCAQRKLLAIQKFVKGNVRFSRQFDATFDINWCKVKLLAEKLKEIGEVKS